MKTSTYNPEFDRFDCMMKRLIKVSHDELKAALYAEKAAKRERPKRARKQNDGRDKNDNTT
jgi:hypothetical protein